MANVRRRLHRHPEEVAALPCDRIHPLSQRPRPDRPPRGVRSSTYGLTADEVRSRYRRPTNGCSNASNRNATRTTRVTAPYWPGVRRTPEAARDPRRPSPTSPPNRQAPVFQFDATIAPDNKLVCIALADAYALGVLSSRPRRWALATGSTSKTTPTLRQNSLLLKIPGGPISNAASPPWARTGRHRKRQQSPPDLTSGMYNNCAGEPYRQGQDHPERGPTPFRQNHDNSTPRSPPIGPDLPGDTDTLLDRLVALNAERRPKKPPATSAGCAQFSRTPAPPPKRRPQTGVRPRFGHPKPANPPPKSSPGPLPCPNKSAPWPIPHRHAEDRTPSPPASPARPGKNASPKSSPCSPPGRAKKSGAAHKSH